MQKLLSLQQETSVIAPSCEEQGGFRFLDNLLLKDVADMHHLGHHKMCATLQIKAALLHDEAAAIEPF